MLNLTDFYNHEKFLQGVREGEKLLNKPTPKNTESQKFRIGDHVISSDLSTYTLFASDDAIIAEVHKSANGFYNYDVEYKKPGCKRKKIRINFLEKELARA